VHRDLPAELIDLSLQVRDFLLQLLLRFLAHPSLAFDLLIEQLALGN
jgi:hypothetical protein